MARAAPQQKIVHRVYEPRHDHNLELDFPGFPIYPFVNFQVHPIYRQKISQGWRRERESETFQPRLSLKFGTEKQTLVAETML